MNQEYQTVAIGALSESPHNPRKSFDVEFLKELEASILAKGLINPLIVRSANGKVESNHRLKPCATSTSTPVGQPGHFEILAGANRFRAAKAAGLKEVPVIVREMDDRAAMELMLLDNLQRVGVHPLEEARGYQALIALGAASGQKLPSARADVVSDIAEKIGKSEKYVWDRLKLLELNPPAAKAFKAGAMTAGHAILLARLEPADQEDLLKQMNHVRKYDAEGLSVRDLENRVRWKKEQKERDARAKVEREKRVAAAKGPAAKAQVSAAAAAEKIARERERQGKKEKAEKVARIATVKAVLAKVTWPLPRAVIELACVGRFGTISAKAAAKLKNAELARELVENLCGPYDTEFYWNRSKSVENVAAAYGVKPTKPEPVKMVRVAQASACVAPPEKPQAEARGIVKRGKVATKKKGNY